MTGAGGAGPRSAIAAFLRRGEVLLALALTAVLTLAFPVVRDLPPLAAFEGHMLDWRFRIRGPEPGAAEIVLVAIDDRTLAALGRWPFSRSWLADALAAVAADGARAVAFDLLFAGAEARGAASGAAPSAAGTGPPADPVGTGADRALVDAVAAFGRAVVPFAFVYDPREATLATASPAIEATAFRVVLAGSPGGPAPLPHPAGIVAPPEPLLSAGFPAHMTVFLEPDGSLRHAHPALPYGDAHFPALPVEAVRLFLGLDRAELALEVGAGVRLGGRFVAAGEATRWPIDYAGPAGSFETLSLVDVVRGDFAPGLFDGRLVLVGATAVGLGDRFATPFTPSLPGMEVFANVAAGLLGRGFLERSARTDGLDLLAVALCGALAAVFASLLRPAVALAALGALAGTLWALDVHAFVAARMWLNVTVPLAAILAVALVVASGRVMRESRLRRRAEAQRERVARFVPPLAATHLEGPGPDRGVPARPRQSQLAAVMFVDLVGFTRLSEAATPQRTAELMHRFHHCVEAATRDHGGAVDNYIGDAVLAVFGLPSGHMAPGHPASGHLSAAVDALACARRIAAEVAGWRDGPAAGGHRFACGIGIHFGPVLVAEVGGAAHAQITVTGDTVNVASRLEELTRDLHAEIVASDAVVDAARALDARDATAGFEEMPPRRLRGRDRPIGIWAWRMTPGG